MPPDAPDLESINEQLAEATTPDPDDDEDLATDEPEPREAAEQESEPPEEPPEGRGPSRAWAEMRNEVKTLRQQLAHQQENLRQNLAYIQQQLLSSQEDYDDLEEDEPTFQEDPDSYFNALRDELGHVRHKLDARELREQEEEHHGVVADTMEWIENDRKTFVEKHPDFEEAEQHVMQTLKQMLAHQNPNATEEQIIHYLESEHIPATQIQFRQSGKSLAEATYELANRFGYRPNGAPARRRSRRPSSRIRAARMAKAGESVGTTPDTGSSPELDARSLVTASPREFKSATKDFRREDWLVLFESAQQE